MARVATIGIAILTATLGGAAPTTTAPAERVWGKSQAGLSVSILADGDWRLDGRMAIAPAVRNRGSIAAPLPAANAFFGYLVIRQGGLTYYTEKIHYASDWRDWPRSLPAGGMLTLGEKDVATLKLFASKRGLPLKDGYPSEQVDGKPVARKPVGTLAEILRPGTVRCLQITYLPRGDERPLLLKSNVVAPVVSVKDFASLPEKVRTEILGDLARRFRRDAFSAQGAHAGAVEIGKPAVTMLATIARDKSAGGPARMWAGTALADIGGDRAAEVLIECLGASDGGVRHVAAYHGLKLRNAKFDQALNARAVRGDQPGLTAWALLGYCRFRKGAAPAELVAAAVDSRNDRVRMAVAEVFSRTPPVASQLPLLRKLAVDAQPQVRHSAASSLSKSGDRSRATMEALLRCLQMPGDRPRAAAANALARIAKKNIPYPASGTDEEKDAAVARWKKWWDASKGNYK